MGVKSGHDLAEVILPLPEDADTPDIDQAAALRALMKFYESTEGGGEEEDEIDLMIQLSGMIYNDTQGND